MSKQGSFQKKTAEAMRALGSRLRSPKTWRRAKRLMGWAVDIAVIVSVKVIAEGLYLGFTQA